MNTMFTESIGDGYKSLYSSPLAEEIILSSELSVLTDSLKGWTTGPTGYAGSDGDVEGESTDIL